MPHSIKVFLEMTMSAEDIPPGSTRVERETSTYRRKSWQSSEESTESFQQVTFYQTWDLRHPENRLTHPDLGPRPITSLAFYRPEAAQALNQLPYSRTSAKINSKNGIAIGASGGITPDRVREAYLQGFSHQAPFEATLREKMTVDEQWKKYNPQNRNSEPSHPMEGQNPITVHQRGNIAVVTINRPRKLNSLNQDHYYRLGECFREIDRRKDVLITVLTGTGRFFSAGADIGSAFSNTVYGHDARRNMSSTYFSNLDITHTFAHHSKILIVALNGPVVGFSAALIAQADFVYAAPHTFLLTPFSSLGVAAEGAASRSFVQRLGISKANEALIMSKKISCNELVASGFVNKVISSPSGRQEDSTGFLEEVLREVDERFERSMAQPSLLVIKDLIRRHERPLIAQHNVLEVYAGLDTITTGVPQKRFQDLLDGKTSHKL
ncbi:ClpP/crotonase-like domain-containing protein [Aspergillus ambiguus]|uniref:enoyl-CoA hydratase/isomerase family protein n=1 Tax=Aspergillus ambiguus TaxID=176160 RepID=UPI003CCD6406